MLELFLICFLSIDGGWTCVLGCCLRSRSTYRRWLRLDGTRNGSHAIRISFHSFSHIHTYRLLSSLFTSGLARLSLGLIFFVSCCFSPLMLIFHSARTPVQNLYWCLIKPTRISGSRRRDYVAYGVVTFLRYIREAKGWFQTYMDHTVSTYRANKTFNPAGITLGKAA